MNKTSKILPRVACVLLMLVQSSLVLADASFSSPVQYSLGAYPLTGDANTIVAADFDGDGNPDLAINTALGKIFVLINKGDGTFKVAGNYPYDGYPGGPPRSMAAADFDGDGKPDLIVVNSKNINFSIHWQLSVLINAGGGTFKPAMNYPMFMTGGSIVDIATGDFSGDGKPDVTVSINGVVYVFINKGDGTFDTTGKTPAVGGGSGFAPAAIDDFNKDGTPDLAVAFTSNTIAILSGGGGTPVYYPDGGLTPTSIAADDFNGDGWPDLAVMNPNTNNISILVNKGDGTFKAAVNYPVGSLGNPSWVAVADFDGDGKPDIISGGANMIPGSGTSILINKGDGTFKTAINSIAVANGVRPSSAAIGDFNGDGKPDLALLESQNFSGVLFVRMNTSTSSCGDGAIEWTETCDDSNVQNGDGCSSNCKVETGWTCSGSPSVCVATCGDQVIVGSEQCDGSNLNSQACTGLAQGFNGGTLACASTCQFDTSKCTKDSSATPTPDNGSPSPTGSTSTPASDGSSSSPSASATAPSAGGCSLMMN